MKTAAVLFVAMAVALLMIGLPVTVAAYAATGTWSGPFRAAPCGEGCPGPQDVSLVLTQSGTDLTGSFSLTDPEGEVIPLSLSGVIFAESAQAVVFSALVQGGETPSPDEPCAPTTFTGTGTIRAFDNTMIIVASGITAICTRETIRLNLTRE